MTKQTTIVVIGALRVNMNFYAFQGPYKILWDALCCHVYHFPRTTAGIRYLSIAGLSTEAVNVPLVRGSSVAFNNSSTSISFNKSLVYAKRRPSFLWKLIHGQNNVKQFFCENICLVVMLNSPWKLALNQSMTFHKRLLEQLQTLRLSAFMDVDSNNSSARIIIIRTRHLIISPHVIWGHTIHISQHICRAEQLFGPRQAEMCLRTCAICADSDSLRACAKSSGYLLSTDTFYKVQRFCWQIAKALIRLRECAGWSGPSQSAHARRHIFAWHGPFCNLYNIWTESEDLTSIKLILPHPHSMVFTTTDRSNAVALVVFVLCVAFVPAHCGALFYVLSVVLLFYFVVRVFFFIRALRRCQKSFNHISTVPWCGRKLNAQV